jgi:hypothetical protein
MAVSFSPSIPSTQPTQIPSAIQAPFSGVLSNINQGELLFIIFALMFISWLIYTAIVTYHWIRYGHRSWLVVPALAAHVIVSGVLFIVAFSGFIGT